MSAWSKACSSRRSAQALAASGDAMLHTVTETLAFIGFVAFIAVLVLL
jgi:hypothetical protein